MRAHVIENGIVTNSIEVDSLDFMPNLVDGEKGGAIGDFYQSGQFIKPPVDTKKLAADIRSQRNALLSESDWTQANDIPDSISTPWATYRQALRDLPQQDGFPVTIVWPAKP
jgi:hypothetical protein